MNKLILVIVLLSNALWSQHSHITVATLDIKPMLISWTVEEHSKDCKEIFSRDDFTINLPKAKMYNKLGTEDFAPEEASQVMGGIVEDLPDLQTAADICNSGPIRVISVRPDGGYDDILTSRLLTIEGWPDPKINCGKGDLKVFDPSAFGSFANNLIRYVMAATVWWKEQLIRA